MDSGGVTKYDAVVSVIRKPPSGRNDFMVNDLIAWFRKRSRLFESLKTEILFDVIKNVAFLSCQRDDILIKEGDQGDCMYIILRGSVSIYRLMEATRILDEDTTTTTSTTTSSTTTTSATTTNNSSTSAAAGATTSTADIAVEQTSVTENIRIALGERVAGLGEPSTFGDVALMSEDCIRTASVIVDEPSDFIVFDRDLYNRSVKSVLKKEFEDKTNFIDRSHYFRSWQPMYRKQLAMAMVKETVPFNSELTKQGNHVDTIYFLLSGEVKVTVDPWLHKTQYPKLLTKTDPTEKIRSQPNNCKQEPNQSSTQTDLLQSKKRCRPSATEGLESTGKVGRRTASSVEVCLLGINACVGDIEVLMDLTTYLQTSTCTQRTEVLILETRHFERLFTRRHPRTVDRMKENLMTRLQFRLASAPPALYFSVPLLHRLLEKVEEYNRRKLSQTAARQLRSWAATITDEKTVQSNKSVGSGMFDGFVPLQGALIDIQGPGTVFHHIRQREQARLTRLTKGGRIQWGQGFGSVLTTKRLRFGRTKLGERVDDGGWDRDGGGGDGGWEEEDAGGGGGDGGASTADVDAIVKKLEERMQEWHLSNKTHALTIRDKPLIAKLHRTQTESLVRQAAGVSPPRSMHAMHAMHAMQFPPRPMHSMDRSHLRRSPPSPSSRRKATIKPIRTEQNVNKRTVHKKVKDMKRRKDGIRNKAAEDKDALDFTRLAQFENDILTHQNDSWV